MVGSKCGLVSHLKQLGIKCVFLHSIIHQEALCGKIVKMNQNMKRLLILSILFAEETKLKNRVFIAFLEEMDANYGKITLHFDIRWMSVGRCLQFFFFALRKEIFCFFKPRIWDKNSSGSYKIWDSYHHVADLTSHLHILNLKLQGKGQNISHLVGHIEEFRKN
jgi:hypothetical protein